MSSTYNASAQSMTGQLKKYYNDFSQIIQRNIIGIIESLLCNIWDPTHFEKLFKSSIEIEYSHEEFIDTNVLDACFTYLLVIKYILL